jgi:molecular chaperone GrpE
MAALSMLCTQGKNAPTTWSDLVRHTKKKPEQHESGVNDGVDMPNEEQASAPHDEPMDSAPNRDDALEDRLKALEQEKNDLSDRLLRTMAEFDNYRKRVTREKEGLLKYGTERIAFEILPVIDNFERAMEQSQQGTDPVAVVDGLKMILKQLMAALEKFEIKPFHSVGEQFNPEIHEAMAQQEHPDHEDNTVIEQFQKGYMLGEKMLRPARVLVSRAPATPDEA